MTNFQVIILIIYSIIAAAFVLNSYYFHYKHKNKIDAIIETFNYSLRCVVEKNEKQERQLTERIMCCEKEISIKTRNYPKYKVGEKTEHGILVSYKYDINKEVAGPGLLVLGIPSDKIQYEFMKGKDRIIVTENIY